MQPRIPKRVSIAWAVPKIAIIPIASVVQTYPSNKTGSNVQQKLTLNLRNKLTTSTRTECLWSNIKIF